MALRIKVISPARTVRAKPGERLADALERAGIPLRLDCNKRGLCGKCFVEVLHGQLPPAAAKEKFWQKQKGLDKNYRLSCLLEVKDNLEIRLPEESIPQEVPILPRLSPATVKVNPAVKKYVLELQPPGLESPTSLFEKMLVELGTDHLRISLHLLRQLGPKVAKADYKVVAVTHRDKEILAVEPASDSPRVLGLAVDVGTTTLAVELIDLESGQTIDAAATLNDQARRGADVISRITQAMSGGIRAFELTSLVLNSLTRLVGRLTRRNGVLPTSIYEIVVSGNTTMNHLLLGVPVDSLAIAPFHAVFSRLPYFAAQEVGLAAHPEAKVYFSPNIKSFIGGDITSGLLATRLDERRGNLLFIDLGTNGEIVLKTGKRLVATSTAAGPAFEGMNISCGMPALAGAIYKVESGARGLKLFTIGNQPARGVCGTGLIDLVALSLERGEISARGNILNKSKKLRVTRGFSLTQADVRHVQLACAAIKTGIRMMLTRNGLRESDLDRVFIAGAFGNYLNIRNAMAIGLLPSLDERRVIFVGNSSLAGARLLLLAVEERERVERLIQKIDYVSLASDPRFQDAYIRALEFKRWP